MSSPDDHEVWDELAAGYALHALEPDEELAFTTHLAGCERCRATVDEHALVAAQLGALAQDSELQAPSWQSIRTGVVGDGSPVADLATRRERRTASPLARRALAVAAGIVVLAGIGTVGWQLTDRGTSSNPGLAAIDACTAASGCTTVRLQADGRSAAVLLVDRDAARMVPTGLDPLPAGRAYALWQLPRDGRPVLVGEMAEVPAGGSARVPLALPYDDTAAFAVSVEPVDTVPTKPTHVLAVGTAA
jgi:anti-sigma-K factor RskA